MSLGYTVLQLFLFTVCATCNVISPVKYVLYLYISISRSLSAAPNVSVFAAPLISCFPGMLLRYWVTLKWVQFIIINIIIIIIIISKCWDVSQNSKLPPRASHVALPT